MIIDIHTHFIPQDLIDQARGGMAIDGLTTFFKEEREFIQHRQGARYPLPREFHDRDEKLEQMDALNIDISILSAAPTLFMYWLDKKEGSEFCAWMNEKLAEYIQPSSGRLFGLATVPLQDPGLAVQELRRTILELKFCGVQIGTSIESKPLDDPAFEPFFKEASHLGVPVLIHPYSVGKRERFEAFHLNNMVGNPLDTEIAAARMIFSGFLDRFPDLKIILVHGGGFLHYQIGRFNHTYSLLPENERPAHPPGFISSGSIMTPSYLTLSHWIFYAKWRDQGRSWSGQTARSPPKTLISSEISIRLVWMGRVRKRSFQKTRWISFICPSSPINHHPVVLFRAYSAVTLMVSTRLTALAFPFPAISNAVP